MDKSVLTLWDTSSETLSSATFELRIQDPEDEYSEITLIRNYESNHKLPFYEDPSEGIVGISEDGRSLVVVPVRTLRTLSKNHGRVAWDMWGKYATELWFPGCCSYHVLHSQVVYFSNQLSRTPTLEIYDFSRRLKRRKLGHNKAYPTRTIALEGIDPFHHHLFELTEGGVYADTVS